MKRRNFIIRMIQSITAVVIGVFVFSSCDENNDESKNTNVNSDTPCNALSQLSEEERVEREGYNYIDKTASPKINCANCDHWGEPEKGEICGSCDLFEGPVSPVGYCSKWTALDS